MTTSPNGHRWAVRTASCGTVFIAVGAFWLSFTALTDLALRSGIGAGQAWAWPLIVDGIIVVSTVAVVALAGKRNAWYPWALLVGGAVVSVTANAIHAILAADADVPSVLAGAVAAVPPVVLLAITHLTVILARANTATTTERSAEMFDEVEEEPPAPDRRDLASALRGMGWTNKQIANELDVHPSTIGRWLIADEQQQEKSGAHLLTNTESAEERS